MPATYFISPFQPPTWSGKTDLYLDIDEYISKLSNAWGNSKTTINLASETYVASWEIPTGDGNYITGGLQKEQEVVSCAGSPKQVATFAIWHRQNIPRNIRLFLFDESLYVNMELKANTTLEEIIQRIR